MCSAVYKRTRIARLLWSVALDMFSSPPYSYSIEKHRARLEKKIDEGKCIRSIQKIRDAAVKKREAAGGMEGPQPENKEKEEGSGGGGRQAKKRKLEE